MEIEAKTKVENLEEEKQKLISRGAKFGRKKKQVDFYYKERGKEKEPQKPGSFVLRIREQEDKNFLTFKALTDQKGAWVEHEVEIDNLEEVQEILSKIGYVKVLTITKERIIGKFEDFEICLDNIMELGTFIEFALNSEDKTEGREKILQFLSSLGFKEEDVEHRGYARILFEKQGIVYKGVN